MGVRIGCLGDRGVFWGEFDMRTKWFLGLLLCFGLPLLGQTLGDVSGRVTDPSGGDKPQYVVAGLHGGQSPECDFTALRVLTWGVARQRYETAYIENDLCGSLPLGVHQTANGADFRFAEVDESNAERIYRMQQTSVRRVRPGEGSRR